MDSLVEESNGDVLHIDSLPDEIILKFFGYLKQNQLGQIARVCRRWNVLTKTPVLWKKVNVKILQSHTSQTAILPKSFIERIPSCVTSIRLDFSKFRNWAEPLDFEELCMRLQEKCSHLEVLILTDSELSVNLPSVIALCSLLLQDVKKLVFHYSRFPRYHEKREFGGTSKIETLDLSCCNLGCFNKPPFSRMPYLKVLCLYGTHVNNEWFQDDTSFLNQLRVLNLGGTWIGCRTFQAVQNHGVNLKELYVCLVNLDDNDLSFNNSVFPRLKTICLRGYCVTCKGIVSLIQSCPSLQNVYVEEDVAESFATHPFVIANRCKSGIVKAISWDHNHSVNYLNK